jgi:hypothetical protein
MSVAARHFELTLLPERFAISRLVADAPIPAWATQGPFFSVTRTGDELSIVSELSRVPVGVQSQPGWRVFKVNGPFVLSEIGVLSALAAPLAEAKISLFANSLLKRITYWSPRRPSRLPSTHLARRDTRFTGAQQNDQ